jgi:hypothetical protein
MMWLLIILGVTVLPVLPVFAYIEYRRWRGTLTLVQPPRDEMNRDPDKPLLETPKRLPRITDFDSAQ